MQRAKWPAPSCGIPCPSKATKAYRRPSRALTERWWMPCLRAKVPPAWARPSWLCALGHQYEVSWVGDSRAYLWTQTRDGGRLERLTTDHFYVQALLASGAIGAEEVDNHPEKNIITQCLGSLELT